MGARSGASDIVLNDVSKKCCQSLFCVTKRFALAVQSALSHSQDMPVQYYLRPNPLPGREGQFMAQVVSVDTVDEEGLVERMTAEHPAWEREHVEAFLRSLVETVSGLVADGYRVNVAGMAQFFPVMTGKFSGAEDEYDKARHELGVAAAVGPQLVENVQTKAVVKKQKPAEHSPTPTIYKETGTTVMAGKVMPGNIGKLLGRRLAFDPKVTDEGVFFMKTEGPKREVRAQVYAVVQPAEIVFQVPELGKGSWTLEVRARVRGGKQLRAGSLSVVLEAMV